MTDKIDKDKSVQGGSPSGSAPGANGSGAGGGGGAGGGATNEDQFEKTVISKVPQTPNRAPASGLRPITQSEKNVNPIKKKAKPAPEEMRGKPAKVAAAVKPEDSIPLRLATVAMVILLITGSTVYANTPPLVGFMLMWLAMIGTLLSYLFRVKRPMWIGILPTIGALALITYMVTDCVAQLNLGQINFLASFTQALAGFLALHCFDLRTRADFSISALIGLGLLVCISGAANDMLFFICILGYITTVSLILYFDGVSRSRDVGPSRPIGDGRPASLPKPSKRTARAATSIILIPVLTLPLLTILMFFFMPRTSSFISWILENGIRPYVAVSQTSRAKGYSPGLGSGATPGKKGSGGTAPGGAPAPGGTGGGAAGGNPNKAVNPLDKRTSGNAPKGVGGGSGQSSSYKEGMSEKNDEPQNVLPPSEGTEDVILRVSTPRPGYLRRVAFDTYDGSSWDRTAMKEVDFSLVDNQFLVGNANVFGIPRDCPTVEVPQHITVDMGLTGGTLPAMWVPQTVEGPFNEVKVQADGTMKPDVKIESGMTYFVKSSCPVYRLGVLTSQPLKTHSDFKASLYLPPVAEMDALEKELMNRYLQLPDDLPSRVKSRAKKVAGQDGNWFVRAQRIAEYLRNPKSFKYKTKNIYRVKGGDFVDNFLFKTKEGNCVDYASSFVILCRAAGIPARLVGGYLPGKFNQRTGFQEIKVKDGHAWAEIYLPNWSWIAFDPTPVGTLPELQKEDNFLTKLADIGFANPFGGAFQGSSGSGIGHGIMGSKMAKDEVQEKRKKENKPPIDDEEGFDLMKRLAKLRWEPVAIAVILISAGAVIFVILQRQRQKNIILIPENAKRSTLLFFQVVRDLRKYKIVRLPTDTPLDLAARIQEGFEVHRQEGKYVHPELEPLLSNFIEVYTLERFGRKEDRIGELEEMSAKIRKLVSAGK